MLQKIPSYTITLVESENGTLSFADGSSSPAVEGTKISLIIEPTDGCELDTVTVVGDSGQSYDYDKESQSFLMPAENVTVSASFKISDLLNGEIGLPQTGDHARMGLWLGLWLAMGLMSCAGMLARRLHVRISNKKN